MSLPRVWAPRAASVEIAVDGARHPLAPQPDGWWQAETEPLHGADYAFHLDAGPPLPDPRSLWQPHGVDAPSRWLRHESFAWHDQNWRPPAWSSAVVYELHIGTFTPAGTFASAIDKLDYLVQLGVTHVEIMPVAEFSGVRGWGYDGVALFAPHHAYGGPKAFKSLIDACHARGLAVLLDVVYNHLGPVGNYLDRFGPYFTDRYHTPWGAALNFDGPASDEVRAFFIANALSWLADFHLDGLRLDAVHAILDQSAVTFLEELAQAVRALEAECGRLMVLIAESDANDPRLSAPAAAGGAGLDAQWNEDFHHALHALLTGERTGYYADFGSLEAMAVAFRHGFYMAGRYSRYRRRRHGRPVERGARGERFVVYAQNHDQAGNRAQGERLSQLVSPGLLRVAAALVLLSPYVPLLFQGEEWGASTPFLYFTDHADPSLAAAVRAGRPPDSPDPQAPATFARSRLRWQELDEPGHATLLDWHRALIRLRRSTDLGAHDLGQLELRYDEVRRWLILARGPHWRIACNLAASPQALPLGPGGWRLELASAPGARLDGELAVLPAEAAAVFRVL